MLLQSIVTQGWRRIVQAAMGLGVAATLVACGGGGGSAGDPVLGGGGGTGGGTTTPVAADLVITLSTANLTTDAANSSLVTVYAVDAKRNTVAEVPVTISADANAIVTTSAKVTDASGVVTGTVRIGSDTSKRTITVTAVSGSITKTATLNVIDPLPSGSTGGPTLTVGLSTAQITPAVPATVTMTLKSATGAPLSDVVVSLTTGRGTLADVSVATVRTDANGTATATLKASNTGNTGADYLNVAATVANVTVTAQQAFSVTGALPTLTLSPSTVTLRLSQPAPQVMATVLDAAGRAVASLPVTFTSDSGRIVPTPTDVATDTGGVARSTLRLATGAGASSTLDAVRVTANYTPSGSATAIALSASVQVQIVGESPTATLNLTNSTVTSTAPATATALVRDVSGNPVAAQLVQFTSQLSQVKFDPSTALTDATGVARTTVTPVTASANGADIVRVSTTLNGQTAADSRSVQVVSAASPGAPQLQLSLSSLSVTSGAPATVTATLTDSRAQPVVGQVVTFSVVRNLGRTNVGTALTDANGKASALLSPTSSASAGADEVAVSVTYAGTSLSASQGFQVQPTNASIVSFTGPASISAYGQDVLTLTLTGASVGAPVKLSLTSSCAAAGKATVSPSAISTSSNVVTLQYRDNGCGAIQANDLLQVIIDGTSTSQQLSLPIAAPAATSVAFISAAPEQIFLKGSGYTESSLVTFEVRDSAGNTLPNKSVDLKLLTGAGGVTMQGGLAVGATYTAQSNAQGRVSVQVNSGTQPTPIRIQATLTGTTISTVSSNLSVATGLPSQLNFSMSQRTRNIEGYDIDGTPNAYTIIAADRSGNAVPASTSINFVTEGGQVEAVRQIQIVNGIAQATANFSSSEPRPADGRVTVVAYALGEESFIDLNGSNIYQSGNPFQDLGNIFISRDGSGVYKVTDQVIGLRTNNSSACAAVTDASVRPLLALDGSIPSVPNTCDGVWSGAGQVYVRRAVETVFSTSSARPLWPLGTSNVTFAGSQLTLQVSSSPSDTRTYYLAGGDTICTTNNSGSFTLLAADANPGNASQGILPRLNPMAAGTVVTSSTSTSGFSTSVNGGSPVASTTDVTAVSVGYSFDTASRGDVFVTFRSPSGLGTTVGFAVQRQASCP
jgi:5-hydroxyisourate hydrolase-like protein (transthyretin family)